VQELIFSLVMLNLILEKNLSHPKNMEQQEAMLQTMRPQKILMNILMMLQQKNNTKIL
jgi:hypothetical protein